MTCPGCGGDQIAFGVPPAEREFVPGEESAVALCPDCLSLRPATEPGTEPSFERLHPAFPSGSAGVSMAILLGLLDELALHRQEISTLLERVEREGVDPLLVLSRLAGDPDIDPGTDLEARRRQLEQLL